METERNYSQLREQEKFPKRTNNETEIPSLLDLQIQNYGKKKMLTELRKIINRNAEHCNKEPETKDDQSRVDS